MAFDDQRPLLGAWADEIMSDDAASRLEEIESISDSLTDSDMTSLRYISGWAVHWYTDFLGFPQVLDGVQEKYPEKFIFFSEACTGANPWDLQKVILTYKT